LKIIFISSLLFQVVAVRSFDFADAWFDVSFALLVVVELEMWAAYLVHCKSFVLIESIACQEVDLGRCLDSLSYSVLCS
jgi:hypothetical protein